MFLYYKGVSDPRLLTFLSHLAAAAALFFLLLIVLRCMRQGGSNLIGSLKTHFSWLEINYHILLLLRVYFWSVAAIKWIIACLRIKYSDEIIKLEMWSTACNLIFQEMIAFCWQDIGRCDSCWLETAKCTARLSRPVWNSHPADCSEDWRLKKNTRQLLLCFILKLRTHLLKLKLWDFSTF